MKIKVNPKDFVVSEVTKIQPEGRGDYALYLLTKENLTTWEALGRLAKTLRIPLERIGYGGLKDKRALTHQFITLWQGPKKDFTFPGFKLTYLGQTSIPMEQSLLLGNNFVITVREVEMVEKVLDKEMAYLREYGLPNYFDEQRFGSVVLKKDGNLEFAAKEIIKGNWERALYLALAEASPDDIKESKGFRECLKKNWGLWERCLPLAKLNWTKNLLHFLNTHPSSKRTFKRALQLMDQEYLFFLGNAYQSYLWNEILKKVLQKKEAWEYKVPYKLGELYFYRCLPEEVFHFLVNLKIPLPSPKLNLETGPLLVLEAFQEVLEEEGFKDLKELRSLIKGLIFKTYPRPAIVFPRDLRWERVDKRVFRLYFFLEKGAYATLVLKRLFYAGSHT